jgi:hypothetical protein
LVSFWPLPGAAMAASSYFTLARLSVCRRQAARPRFIKPRTGHRCLLFLPLRHRLCTSLHRSPPLLSSHLRPSCKCHRVRLAPTPPPSPLVLRLSTKVGRRASSSFSTTTERHIACLSVVDRLRCLSTSTDCSVMIVVSHWCSLFSQFCLYRFASLECHAPSPPWPPWPVCGSLCCVCCC